MILGTGEQKLQLAPEKQTSVIMHAGRSDLLAKGWLMFHFIDRRLLCIAMQSGIAVFNFTTSMLQKGKLKRMQE